MSSWGDLLDALAARKPEIKMVPPRVSHEDLWEQQERIKALEAEVENLKFVLARILGKLSADETKGDAS